MKYMPAVGDLIQPRTDSPEPPEGTVIVAVEPNGQPHAVAFRVAGRLSEFCWVNTGSEGDPDTWLYLRDKWPWRVVYVRPQDTPTSRSR